MDKINGSKIIKYLFFSLSALFLFFLCKRKKETVTLSIWADRGNSALIEKRLEEFKEKFGKNVDFNFTIIEQDSFATGDSIIRNPAAAADIFTFADDQFEALCKQNLLLCIDDYSDEVIKNTGGKDSPAIQSATKNGKLYAFPTIAGNGYFLYYNSKYLSESDVQTFDRLLAAAKALNKKVGMDIKNGWYLYSFFKGAGLDVYANEDQESNTCNWDSTTSKITGLSVAKAIRKIALDENFVCLDNSAFEKSLETDEVIAAVNGMWNATTVANSWKDGYAACKLPTYTVNGNQVQMCSFTGFKLTGVKSNTSNPRWALAVASWLSNKETQLAIFEKTGECPANIEAADSTKTQASPAAAALAEQAPFASIQRISSCYWEPSWILGVILTSTEKMTDSFLQEKLSIATRDICRNAERNN